MVPLPPSYTLGLEHKSPSLLKTICITAVIISAVLAAVIGLAWVLDPSRYAAAPAYSLGDTVRMKISGDTGMVIAGRCGRHGCTYSVRFNAPQTQTNTRLLGRDKPVEHLPVARVDGIREFELEPVR